MRVLRMADGDGGPGGGGSGAPAPGGSSFLTTLPEDLRAEPSLATFKDVGSLAKSYVSAQKMIGQKRVAVPDKSWSESQWNEFYAAAGRPETFDKYEIPDVKMEPGFELDKTKRDAVLQQFHKLGLSSAQGRGVMEYYLASLNESAKSQASSQDGAVAAAQAQLKQEWGDKYGANMDMAKAVVRKFGDENFQKWLDDSKMGNNPQLVKMLSKVGSMIVEDTSRGGGADFGIQSTTRAIQEIDSLKGDKSFMVSLGNASDPGHRAAVERWANLFKVAYPGKQQES